MDALDLLEQQHTDVGVLIDRIAAEPSPGRRTALVARLARVIDAHVRIEEAYLYPVCAARMAHQMALHEAYEQHALTCFAADKLVRTRATDVRFDARLRVLRELFDRHAGDEEDWLFPKAKRHLTDEQLDALGCDLARAYALLLRDHTGTGPPNAPKKRAIQTPTVSAASATPSAVTQRAFDDSAAATRPSRRYTSAL